MANANTDTIEYQILMEASKAIQDLNTLTANVASVDEKMKLIQTSMTDFATRTGNTLPQVESLFSKVQASAARLQITMSELGKSGLGMNLGPLERNLMGVQPIAPPPLADVGKQKKDMEELNLLAAQYAKNMGMAAKSAAGMSVPIRQAGDNMKSLLSFAEGKRGQGIFADFLGGYNAATTAVGQINTIKVAMTQLKNESGASLSQVGTLFKNTFTNIPTGQVDQAMKELNKELNQVPENAGRAVHSIDAIRIALGAIVAMLVFQVIQAFSNFFTNAIKDAREFEGVLYNVANAEKIMSQQGVEIAPKDFDTMITKLRELVPMLSQLDATKAVGNLALFTKDLGYTKDQIGSLADAIGVLYIRNRSLGLSFEQVQSQVQTGILTGRAQGIRDLGVSISEDAIKFEALRLKLVDSDKAFQQLTGDTLTQVKAQAMLSIITQSTADEQKNLGEYMKTSDAKMSEASAKIRDIGATLGKIYLPILGLISEGLTKWVETVYKAINAVNNLAANFGAALTVIYKASQGLIKSGDDVAAAYTKSYKTLYEGFSNIWKLTGDLSSAEDTATGSTQNLTQSLVDMSKVDLSSLVNSLQSIQDRLNDLNRDYAQKSANYLTEFNTKMSRMQEDYQASVQATIQDFANRRADLEANYRNQQLEAEAKYQEQMRELRSKYLYDLEDALRNRDARQVLRLQAQYKMDKENLTKNFEIENAARARQYATELAQLKRNEAQKLAEMAAAEAIKEARAREDFAREQAQRKQEYENQLADLKRSWDEKLAEEARKIAEEYGIRGKGVDDIKKLLEEYYGPNGVFDGLYQYSYDSLVSKGDAMLAQMAAIISAYQTMTSMIGAPSPGATSWGGGENTGLPGQPAGPSSWGGGENTGGGGGTPYAKGGIAFANKPTTATFGEAGPEIATFLPLGKSLKDIPNNLPPSLASKEFNGLIRLMIDLNPDLESRITENTLKKAADITTHVYRRRQ